MMLSLPTYLGVVTWWAIPIFLVIFKNALVKTLAGRIVAVTKAIGWTFTSCEELFTHLTMLSWRLCQTNLLPKDGWWFVTCNSAMVEWSSYVLRWKTSPWPPVYSNTCSVAGGRLIPCCQLANRVNFFGHKDKASDLGRESPWFESLHGTRKFVWPLLEHNLSLHISLESQTWLSQVLEGLSGDCLDWDSHRLDPIMVCDNPSDSVQFLAKIIACEELMIWLNHGGLTCDGHPNSILRMSIMLAVSVAANGSMY